MRACQLLSAQVAMPRVRAVALIADRPADFARLEGFLADSALGTARIVYRGDLENPAPSDGGAAADLALLHLAKAPDPAQCAAIEALTRRLKVVFIGDPACLIVANGIQTARAWTCVNISDLSASNLENAVFGLVRARESEDRLLRALGDQAAHLRRVASAAALIPPVVERMGTAIWQLAGIAAANAVASAAGEAAARAFDVVDDLETLNEELAECLKMTDTGRLATRAADLNELIEDFARDSLAAGVTNISLQTSTDPILVRPAAATIRQLLDALLHAWREVRGADDKLEFLAWDPGREARLAVVLTRSAGLGAAGQAPAHITMRNIFRKLHPLAQACGATVEAGLTPARHSVIASMTICLPKPPPAATPRYKGAALEQSGVRDRAG